MKEIWKPVQGYEGLYEVSDRGRIKSLDRYSNGNGNIGSLRFIKGRIMKISKDTYGYPIITLIGKTFKVHRLVAQSFIKNPKNKSCVNHIDGDKNNNNYENLEWVTYKENTIHAYKHGMMNHYYALKKKDVVKIIKSNKLIKDLAKEYNVCRSVIDKIKNKKTWESMDIPYVRGFYQKINSNLKNNIIKSKLKCEDCCKKYNVSRSTFYRIKREELQ